VSDKFQEPEGAGEKKEGNIKAPKGHLFTPPGKEKKLKKKD